MINPSNALQRVAAGHVRAVQESIDIYGDLVWVLAQRYCRNNAAAEQAVEEVFTDLWRRAALCPDGHRNELEFVAMVARQYLLRRGYPSGTARLFPVARLSPSVDTVAIKRRLIPVVSSTVR